MTIEFLAGKNFSGRSDHLRTQVRQSGGCYIHPDLEINLSGLAETVGGERFLHGLSRKGDIAPDRRLSTLSGGERARLILETCLALKPSLLAVDCALEQLDSARRKELYERLAGISDQSRVIIADNLDRPTLCHGGFHIVEFEHSNTELRDFNAALFEAAKIIREDAKAPTISLEGMSFAYPKSKGEVLTSVNLNLTPSKPYLLKGENGAGKSTLAKLLIGVLKPSRGSISFSVGANMRSHSNVFYAFQNPRDQLFSRNALEYVGEIFRLRDKVANPWPCPWEDARELINAFGLQSFADVEIFDLPPLAQKRLSIAAAVASHSPWIFFDEPAIGLDQEGRSGLATLVGAMARTGRGVILVSHGSEFDWLDDVQSLKIADGQLSGGS